MNIEQNQAHPREFGDDSKELYIIVWDSELRSRYVS